MPRHLKELLKKDLTKKELEMMPTSFDLVGDILIFADFPKELIKKEKKIAKKVLDNLPQVKVVCKKAKQYSGTFRTPKLKILAGQKRKETTHTENNIRVLLDAEKVYFSPRLGHERERISKRVKKDESVLVMFSGCAVYPINIAKNTKAKEIIGIEINPIAHKYGLKNLTLNKTKNISLYKGDVNDILPKIRKKFDRVLMPLPKSAEEYLDIALKKLKKGGMLHFYDFLHENEFKDAEKKVKSACKKNKRSCRIISLVRCGQFGPAKFRVCLDAQIK
ncbi:methyltransferase domain-containing protein [Candidatus Woesearchaeota archaeon]|nr:methyltransferase domain-containing protein [Candidatus Woesearchaeota archaeon]